MRPDVDEMVLFLPPDKRADLERAAKAGNMSVAAAVAFSAAGGEIKRWCPPEERAKVAGLLMRAFLDREATK
jgi:hypothetical protein